MIYLLAIVWPFAAFLWSIRDFNYRNFRIGVLAIAVMFGLCIQIVATQTFQADITRNLEHAAAYKNIPWIGIFLEKDFFIGVSGKLLCYISDNLRFLAVCYTLIKTLLFLQCVRVVVANISVPENRIGLLSLLAMIFVVTFYDVNSLRFAIASVYFVWCSLEILVNRKKWFYVWILAAPFIHYGFWVMAPLPVLYLLLKNRTVLVWSFFVLSILFSTATTSILINDFVEENMTEEISESVGGYASEEGLEAMSERYAEGGRTGNLNRAISRTMVDVRNYGVMICVVLFSIYGFRKRKDNEKLNQLMNFLLIAYSLANIANSNSQGSRFYLLTAEIAVFLLVYLIYKNDMFYVEFYKRYKTFIKIMFYLVIITALLYLFIGRDAMNLKGIVFGNYFLHL